MYEFYLFWQLYGEMANQQACVMQCCDTFTSVVSLQAKQKCLNHWSVMKIQSTNWIGGWMS